MDRSGLDRRWAVLAARGDVGFLLRCYAVYRRIDARDRVYVLAAGAFITLIPLSIVVATVTDAGGTSSLGERMVEELSLSGAAEESVLILFTYPPGATTGITAFSVLLLLYSMNGFFGSVQRTFELAWELPRMGYHGALHRAAGAAVLLCGVVLVGAVGSLIDGNGPLVAVVTVAAQIALLTASWILATDLLLSRRLRRRVFLWGSALSAVMQLAVGWGAAIYLPGLFDRQTSRYGVIGAALAIVTLLIIFASVIVGGAIIGAVLGRRGRVPARPAEDHPEGVRPATLGPETLEPDQVDAVDTAEGSIR